MWQRFCLIYIKYLTIRYFYVDIKICSAVMLWSIFTNITLMKIYRFIYFLFNMFICQNYKEIHQDATSLVVQMCTLVYSFNLTHPGKRKQWICINVKFLVHLEIESIRNVKKGGLPNCVIHGSLLRGYGL